MRNWKQAKNEDLTERKERIKEEREYMHYAS